MKGPKTFYQRVMAFVGDNLLKRNGGTSHHGVIQGEDVELSPTLKILVLTWLRLINMDFQRLVGMVLGSGLEHCHALSRKFHTSPGLFVSRATNCTGGGSRLSDTGMSIPLLSTDKSRRPS